MTTANNYGTGSVHDFKKEVLEIVRPQVERETRLEMAQEPSHEVVDNEVAYRIKIEEAAANKLTEAELEPVYKFISQHQA